MSTLPRFALLVKAILPWHIIATVELQSNSAPPDNLLLLPFLPFLIPTFPLTFPTLPDSLLGCRSAGPATLILTWIFAVLCFSVGIIIPKRIRKVAVDRAFGGGFHLVLVRTFFNHQKVQGLVARIGHQPGVDKSVSPQEDHFRFRQRAGGIRLQKT